MIEDRLSDSTGAARSEIKFFRVSMLFGDLPAANKRQIGPGQGLRRLVSQKEEMKHRSIMWLIALSVLINSGCASIVCRSGFEKKPTSVYPATVLDAEQIVKPTSGSNWGDGGDRPLPPRWHPNSIFSLVVCIIDLPISIVVDTLLLPFDIYAEHKKTKTDSLPPQDGPTSPKR